MSEPIRDGKMNIIGYRDSSGTSHEVLRDGKMNIVGRYEKDTGTTRDNKGNIVGYKSNQLFKFLK